MNKLILTAVTTVAIVAGAGRVGRAQTQAAANSPDFSGKWVFASSQPPVVRNGPNDVVVSGPPPFGGDFSISQDATTLTVDSLGFYPSQSRTGAEAGVVLPFSIRTIYVLDGIEHPSQVIANRPAITSSPQVVRAVSRPTGESISKTTWVGRQLVIMTYSKNKIMGGNVIRRTVRQTLSMEANGTLAVESLIVADPLPQTQAAPSPTPIRTVYKKG
jgi:hypothetical protein